MLNWRDVAKYIEKKDNVTLTPTQKEILKAIIRGETISTPRGCGRTMLYEGYGSYLVEVESKKESPQLRELMTEPDKFDQSFSILHMLDQDYFMGNTVEYRKNHNWDNHYQKFEDSSINAEVSEENTGTKKEEEIEEPFPENSDYNIIRNIFKSKGIKLTEHVVPGSSIAKRYDGMYLRDLRLIPKIKKHSNIAIHFLFGLCSGEFFCYRIENTYYPKLKEENKDLDIFFNTGWISVYKIPKSIFDYGKADNIGGIDVSTRSCSNTLSLYIEDQHKSFALVNFLTDEMALFKTYNDLWAFCTKENIPLNKLKEKKEN